MPALAGFRDEGSAFLPLALRFLCVLPLDLSLGVVGKVEPYVPVVNFFLGLRSATRRGDNTQAMPTTLTREVPVGSLRLGGSNGLFLIAGPCVIESEAHTRSMAERIAAVCAELKLPFIFKTSYDKANRTSVKSYRGPGLTEGLRILAKIKADLKLPILTDVHEPAQVAAAAEVADILQIPAFLSRQTDLIVAAARTGRVVNIKKGQFLAPADMRHAIAKVT